MTIVTNPGTPQMQVIVKDGDQIKKLSMSSGAQVQGVGHADRLVLQARRRHRGLRAGRHAGAGRAPRQVPGAVPDAGRDRPGADDDRLPDDEPLRDADADPRGATRPRRASRWRPTDRRAAGRRLTPAQGAAPTALSRRASAARPPAVPVRPALEGDLDGAAALAAADAHRRLEQAVEFVDEVGEVGAGGRPRLRRGRSRRLLVRASSHEGLRLPHREALSGDEARDLAALPVVGQRQQRAPVPFAELALLDHALHVVGQLEQTQQVGDRHAAAADQLCRRARA